MKRWQPPESPVTVNYEPFTAAEAIAAYEAALRLRPTDARLLENLEFARAAARGSS